MRLLISFILAASVAIAQPAGGGGGGSGNVTVKSNGITIGSRSIFSFPIPSGIIRTITDDGTQLIFNDAVDPANFVTSKIATIQMPIGGCVGGTFSTSWVLGASQTGQCFGSNYAVINLLTTGTTTANNYFQWPADFNNAGAVSVYIKFSDFSGGGGNAQFDLGISCQSAGSAISGAPPFNPSTSTGSITLTPNANTLKEVTVSGLNLTGCSPHNLAVLQIFRNNTVTGNSADGINILNVSLDYARN